MAHSLRSRLLAWVMLPLLGAVAVDAWTSYHDANATATVVQDRMLLGAARMVAEQLHLEDGAFQDHVPPAALELFEASVIDQVYYRVTTGSGQIVTGYAELALPTVELQPETPVFFDSVVRGASVRAVAFLQPVLANPGVRPVLVQIAQTMNGHAALTRSLWLRTLARQLLLLALVALLMLFGLRRGLQPLLRLRDTVAAREPGSLRPLAFSAMPNELSPLVVAINDYARRLDQYAGAQQVFIQNAAHQLRTPLTLLSTQVSYATREDDGRRSESLAAIRKTVQQSARLVNQLLTLSAVEARDHAAPERTRVELDTLVRQVVEEMAGLAQAKDIDLGFERVGAGAFVVAGQPTALHEIAANLIDNAIRYTPAGGIVTARVACAEPDAVALMVEDSGPGIAVSERARVFERFYRINDGGSAGSGLGLPIVREFASRMGASVELRTAGSGQGLTVEVRFRRPMPSE